MFKKELRFGFSAFVRIMFSVLLISFALGTGACSSGGGESTSASGSAQ